MTLLQVRDAAAHPARVLFHEGQSEISRDRLAELLNEDLSRELRWPSATWRDFGGSACRGNRAMAKTYRNVAIEQMIVTVEEAMSRTIDWWGDLPAPINEAVDTFRVQLAAAIDSVEFVKRALDGSRNALIDQRLPNNRDLWVHALTKRRG